MKYRFAFPLIAVLALAGCAETPMSKSLPEQRPALAQVSLEPERARRMINSYRVKRGLKPLTLETRLGSAAKKHAQDLARGDRISHIGANGSDPWSRVKAAGYKAGLAAENVGAGQMSFAELLRGWKNSPGHNRNLLLADATQMGIALAINPDNKYRTFWTLVLAKPEPAAR